MSFMTCHDSVRTSTQRSKHSDTAQRYIYSPNDYALSNQGQLMQLFRFWCAANILESV